MYPLSIFHWLLVLVLLGIWVVPLWRILNKAGYSGAWLILSFVPVVNIIMLWVFAFSTWPRDRQQGGA